MDKAYTYDTITAISTASGKAGIGIVRISGNEAYRILFEIFVPGGRAEIESHVLRYGHITENGRLVDEVIAVYMKAPRTYTREDVVEINCHGGHASVAQVLELVIKKGARLAENGEFTRRAFMNGRIDLSQAEAVMELVNAQTEMSAKAAMLRLGGRLGEIVKNLSGEILTMLANIEVSIDYPEHEMETDNQLLIKEKSIAVLKKIDKLIATSETGRILNTGIEAVIAGRPNVGKSSVLNAFLQEDRAIVTNIPGTTRDPISEFINLKGVPLKITDTAGIRDSDDEIEAIGVERSRKRLTSADIVLFVIDGAVRLSKEDIDLYQSIKGMRHLVLINKSDLPAVVDIESFKESSENIFEISALKGHGLEPVYERIRSMFISGDIEPNSDVMISGLRSKNALLNAAAALREALNGMEIGLTQDLYSIDLRDCYNYLGEITGETLDDKLLDKIFSEFCLGK